MSSLFILLLLLAGSYSATAIFLWLGAKWAKIPRVTLLRAFGATFAIGLLALTTHLGFMWLWSDVFAPLLAGGVELGVTLLVTWLSLKLLFRTSLWRAIVSWLPTLIPGAVAVGLYYLVLAAYITPTHAVAPTLLGPHQQGSCPICRQLATVSFN